MNPKLNCLFIVVCSKYTGNTCTKVSNINNVCVLKGYFDRNYTLIIRQLYTIIDRQKINFK